MKTVKEIFELFTGTWSVARKVPYGEANGIVQFTRCSLFTSLYHEKMKFKSESAAFDARRSYEFRYDHLTDTISKYFSDGRLFYELEFCRDKAFGKHKCNDDRYEAEYNFKDNSFSLVYKVQGPHKNYSIKSEFVPISKISLLQNHIIIS